MSVLSCKETHDFLMKYLDGELDDDVRARFEQHMKLCPPCEDYLHSYEQTVVLARECGKTDLEPETQRAPAHSCGGTPEALIQAILLAQRIQEPSDG